MLALAGALRQICKLQALHGIVVASRYPVSYRSRNIAGDSSPNAEVELIDVTTRALLRIGFKDFTVNINDRRILRAMLEKMGFAADQLDSVCISFDKLDKIGAEA